MIRPDLAQEFAGKRALITGGLGFIGSSLARELVRLGAAVTIVDSLVPEYGGLLYNVAGIEEQVKVNISDVRDEHSLRHLVQDQDVLFNLAGQTSHLDSMADPYTDLEINARSQLSILEAARHGNPDITVVFASTRQLYGRPQRLPVDERHPIAPVDVNGINKAAGEWYHLLYGEVYGIRTSVLRLTNTYGPRMRVRDARQTFLGIWIKQALTGGDLLLYGDGSQRRDLTYVDDAVGAFLLAAVRDEAVGRVFNLGGDGHVSLRELGDLVVRLAGSGRVRAIPFPAERKAIDIGDFYADWSAIESTLGWRPAVALEDGLARTLEYYREHGEQYW
ncbi:MAG TPA: NAD-dependent epimerase/dehydratase family protein [Gaiellaceae bacterium]